jgi:hypothetical protein
LIFDFLAFLPLSLVLISSRPFSVYRLFSCSLLSISDIDPGAKKKAYFPPRFLRHAYYSTSCPLSLAPSSGCLLEGEAHHLIHPLPQRHHIQVWPL